MLFILRNTTTTKYLQYKHNSLYTLTWFCNERQACNLVTKLTRQFRKQLNTYQNRSQSCSHYVMDAGRSTLQRELKIFWPWSLSEQERINLGEEFVTKTFSHDKQCIVAWAREERRSTTTPIPGVDHANIVTLA